MFCFAKVESDQTISEVIVVAQSDCGNFQFPESESAGQSFLGSLGKGGMWLQSSPTGEFRKYPASIGGQYIVSADVFTCPQPYPSWILNSDYEWQAPTPKPDADGSWFWNETAQEWQR
jgi:hypothetical protein